MVVTSNKDTAFQPIRLEIIIESQDELNMFKYIASIGKQDTSVVEGSIAHGYNKFMLKLKNVL